MRTFIYNIVAIIFFLVSNNIIAQNEEDALRYSFLQYGGTARYMSVGGAFGALGADLSVLSTNPAGLARFKNSEFSFSPGLSLSATNSSWKTNTNSNDIVNMNIPNIGIVLVNDLDNENSKWKRMQFAYAYNRLADFNKRYTISGINDASMSYEFANISNGFNPEDLATNLPFDGDLAYQTWITDFDTLTNSYSTRMGNENIQHEQTVSENGRVGESTFSFAGDYNHKIYFGGSLGLPGVNFRKRTFHSENELRDSTEDIQSFEYNQELITRGSGINIKLGIMASPTPWLRLGLAYHSPTYFTLTDRWNSNMSSTISATESHSYESPQGTYEYTLTTPSNIIASMGFVLAKRGMISVDYVRKDYSQSYLDEQGMFGVGSGYSFDAENNAIDSNYALTNNLRVGSEFKINDFFMIRAGYSYYESPYANNDEMSSKVAYSTGFGYRNKNYYVDFAYRITKWTEDYYMYDPALVERAELNTSLKNYVLTVGWKF
jgi:long-subunit fatty acid transport protein